MEKTSPTKFNKEKIIYILILSIETIAIIFFLSLFSYPIEGGVGGNVTVVTTLNIGNTYPEVLNTSITDGNVSFYLTPNTTTTLNCAALLRDYDNETDIANVSAEFYTLPSIYGDDIYDNNTHYINRSCTITRTFGSALGYADDIYLALANCSFDVQYYANPTSWNCTVTVNDTSGWNSSSNDSITMNELLAVGVPSTISFGNVSSTYVSDENITNITNVGNVKINLSLYGYGYYATDGNAMNCTLGSNKNITIENEKYNLTGSSPGTLTLGQTGVNYTNLSNTATIKKFNLDFRKNEGYNEAVNQTYWRIYVPLGVAGTCVGRLVVGATKSSGT